MVKCSNKVLLSKTKKLFNQILDSGSYAKTWNSELILSINKHGSKKEPSNY